MKPIHALFSTAVATAVLLPNFAFAQPNDAPATETQWRLVPLKNVPPDYMAWLLDSQHNPIPDKAIVPLSQVPTGARLPRAKGGLFELPAGVATLIPAPTQGGLLVNSTEPGARQLQNIVDLLDRPLREVEIKAQVVAINDEDAQTLGLNLTSLHGPFTTDAKESAEKARSLQLGFLRRDYEARLAQLILQKKATVVASFGVTSFNNMSASMGVTTSVPAVVGVKDEAGAFQSLFDASRNTPAPRLFVTRETGFLVTPTINNDGTITLTMQSSKTLQLTFNAKKSGQILSSGYDVYVRRDEALPQQSADGITLAAGDSVLTNNEPNATRTVQTVVNLKDGDTLALLGLPRSAFDNKSPNQDADAPKTPSQTIVFITAHVLPPLT